tara:strand:+ start:24114 stop:24644 length:531 start_codon:yes stop_codon:yes gene_type:complete
MTKNKIRDNQRKRVYLFQRNINVGKKFATISEAQKFCDFYFDLLQSFLLKVNPNREIVPNPKIMKPHGNRKRKSTYKVKANTINCRYERLRERVIIHELCHALNTYKNYKGKRRTIGAGHGKEYATIFVFALIVWACETNKGINVWYLADKSGIKYDNAIVKQLFKHYQDYNLNNQ